VFKSSKVSELGINEIDTNVREAAVIGKLVFSDEDEEPEELKEFLTQALPDMDEKANGTNLCKYIFTATDQTIAGIGIGFAVTVFFVLWVSVGDAVAESEKVMDLLTSGDVYYTCQIGCLASKGLDISEVIISENGVAQNTQYA